MRSMGRSIGIVGLLLVPAAPVSATTLCVNPGGTGGCFGSLQAAVNAAASGDAIDVAPGTYFENDIFVSKSVNIVGAGSGATIVDGSVGGVNGPNPVFRFPVNPPQSTATLAHMTIQRGYRGVNTGRFNFVTLANVLVTGNGPGSGAGVFNNASQVTILDSTIANNSAADGFFGCDGSGGAGGGFASLCGGGSYSIIGSTVANNTATNWGGGGILIDGNTTIVNSTFSGNRITGGARLAAALVITTGTISHTTFAGNDTGAAGGGALLTGNQVTLRASVLDANAGGNCVFDPAAPILSGGYNVVSDGSCGLAGPGDLSGAAAMLAPLSDQGGPTLTHALLSGSPAIDRVDAAACPPPAADQRGVARPLGSACDSGAFEGIFDAANQNRHAPLAVDDSALLDRDGPLTIDVLANDSDPDGDPLSVTSVGQPLHGTTALNADGTLTYERAAGFNGPDRFTYSMSDGFFADRTATVRVTVLVDVVVREGVTLGERVVLGAGCWLGERVTIGDDVRLGADCKIDADVVIGNGAQIGERVHIQTGSRVAAGATLDADVKIGKGVYIGADVTIGARTVVGHYAKIGAGASIGSDVTIKKGGLIGNGTIVANGATVVNAGVAFVADDSSELTASDAAAGDLFGTAVAIDGDVAVVGSRFDDGSGGTDSGSAYVYRYDGTEWRQEARLSASDAAPFDQFGTAVAIRNGVIVVGAPLDDDPVAGANAGSAYVFRHDGTSWVQEKKLTASDRAFADAFGGSVAASDGLIVVGAQLDDDPLAGVNAGSAYVFRWTGGDWIQEAKLVAVDRAANDQFGRVAVDGSVIAVGSRLDDDRGFNSGSVYVFRFDGANWAQEAKLTAADGADFDQFGSAVGVSGETVVVGAPFKADAPFELFNVGSAYLFTSTGGSWALAAKLAALDPADSDQFGSAVAVAGNAVLVGSRGDDAFAGSAYLFRFDGAAAVPAAKLMAFDRVEGDSFGASVALTDGRAVVGANGTDGAGSASGSSYVFDFVFPGTAGPGKKVKKP